jgi:hypothetical protein
MSGAPLLDLVRRLYADADKGAKLKGAARAHPRKGAFDLLI